MEVTRRKFLKGLAVAMIAPAAVAKAAAAPATFVEAGRWVEPVHSMSYKWVSFEELQTIYPLRAEGIEGDKPLCGEEEWLGFDKSPLFKGELGQWEGVTLHQRK